MQGILAEEVMGLLNYDPETGIFTRKVRSSNAPAGAIAGSLSLTGYLTIGVKGKNLYAHRLAFLIMTGEWPSCEVDHIDGDRRNNSWSNLRAVTHAQNVRNNPGWRRKKVSIATGVRWRKGKWDARIMYDGDEHWLGRHETLLDAVAARKRAERSLFGEYARR